ncbi:MAG: response regulator transcription factor [Kiritimatiellales bacterium]|nr:response regulator transcription factor [Kiritimatiellales bacterium]MCF7863743.1 response regulator transcription factor [Kiritimatiellales bacterium]
MKIVIVEDDIRTQENLKILLQGERNIERVETFDTAEQAMAGASWNDTDILLADVGLPDMSGVDLIGWAHLTHPHVNAMVYTVHENSDTVFSAIKAGACGYLLKSSTPRELIESLGELYAGGAPMSPKIARMVLRDIHLQKSTHTEPENLLTSREQVILRNIDDGLSYKEVASDLHISPHTVHTHIKKIYEKVQAGSRDEVIRKARCLGWI